MSDDRLVAYALERDADGAVVGRWRRLPAEASPTDEPERDDLGPTARIRVAWSSLNYKDALVARGRPGFPFRPLHVPGVDAAGTVEHSDDPAYSPGTAVVVTGYGFGTERRGGWAERARVPTAWLAPLPAGLDARTAMIYGTAGLTAALSLDALERCGAAPDAGEYVVTGAGGGVGSLAVQLLACRGYRVVAVTGRPELVERLTRYGAARVVSREELADRADRPLLTARWAGGVDCVGGTMLAALLKATRRRGCVAACGLVGSAALPTTVHPFILRGVTLAGVDSAEAPAATRRRLWSLLAGAWRPPRLEEAAVETPLGALNERIDAMLHGAATGRQLLDLSQAPALDAPRA